MSGKHRAGAVTEPMKAVRPPLPPPRDPAPETASMPAITPEDVAAYDLARKTMDADEWMGPLRTGGGRVEARMRATFRERGLILAKRVSRKALRLRAALAKGGRR